MINNMLILFLYILLFCLYPFIFIQKTAINAIYIILMYILLFLVLLYESMFNIKKWEHPF